MKRIFATGSGMHSIGQLRAPTEAMRESIIFKWGISNSHSLDRIMASSNYTLYSTSTHKTNKNETPTYTLVKRSNIVDIVDKKLSCGGRKNLSSKEEKQAQQKRHKKIFIN